jgi:hypothetical protein
VLVRFGNFGLVSVFVGAIVCAPVRELMATTLILVLLPSPLLEAPGSMLQTQPTVRPIIEAPG